ncbi:MAG: DUF364 domain-containing protein [Candidatus Thermoplasmatota archaeon]|nr:DUF364 domain-containing protein [Candidatus Thermoplasmatota archaeon]MBU4255949.1 DUF364 domain-containing protein [Candidatus Thermoplasmatota archaeon]MCG2825516.1 DUF364 domain-containing protein [Thermoplasmatales archaeon]
MKLIDEIIGSLETKLAEDIRVGLKYTGVEIDGNVGLAYTFSEYAKTPRDVGNLIGKDVTKLAHSWNLTESSIGVAGINALIKPKNYKELEISNYILKIAQNYNKIGIVGLFWPWVKKFPSEKEVFIFEKRAYLSTLERLTGVNILPDSSEEDIIPKCDLVIISGSTFVNKTIERLLELSQGYTMIIGPTTILSPVLFDYNVDALAGVVVTDPEKALRIVSQGGGRRELEDVIKFIYMEKK